MTANSKHDEDKSSLQTTDATTSHRCNILHPPPPNHTPRSPVADTERRPAGMRQARKVESEALAPAPISLQWSVAQIPNPGSPKHSLTPCPPGPLSQALSTGPLPHAPLDPLNPRPWTLSPSPTTPCPNPGPITPKPLALDPLPLSPETLTPLPPAKDPNPKPP
nr:extensin-like [Penaeus vannamei]